MTELYDCTVGDVEFEIEIDGEDMYISSVYTDLGMDVDDLYFICKKTNKQVNYGEWLLEQAYEKFIDEWGSVENLERERHADDKYDEDR